MKKTSSSLAILCSAFVISNSAFAAQPNVLFIAVDDMRPELGCYGNKIIKTPNMDRLAARGTIFNYAYCQQAVCSPSRTAMLTGLRPDVTKVWDLETHFRVAQPDCITLPQHFKMNGYHCAALSKVYHKGLEDGRSWSEPHWYPFGKSVDTDLADYTKQIVTRHDVNKEEYSKGESPDDNDKPAARKNGKKAKGGAAFEVSPKSEDDLPDGATAAEAVKRLHELKSKGKPFFFAVGFLKPHLPFVSPKKYWDLYDPNTIPLPVIDHLPEGCPEFAGHQNSELHNYQGVPKGNPIPADFAKTLRHGYYAAISYTDTQVGKVLDALDKEGLADNTIIVLWGDHGWQLGDHGLWEKHTNFEIACRAPLIISLPHQKSAGKKCDAPVEFVDVYPTLADLCGLPIPAGVAGSGRAGLDGSSLRPYIENPSAPMQKVAISQYPRKAGKTGGGDVMGYSIRDERYRCTIWREIAGPKIIAVELYDEKNDPAETVSLHDKPGSKAIIEAFAKHLPPVGSSAPGADAKGKGKAADAKPAKPANDAATTEDRGPRFDKLDKDRKGRLTLEEYISRQPDAAAAKERFGRFDANKDGVMTRGEFVTQGGRHPNAK